METPTLYEADIISGAEAERLNALETTIERGLYTFVDVGNALLEIRDSRLYRTTHGTFEEYCRERWGMSRIHAHRMIDAATVSGNLLPMGNTPASERQARPLVSLPATEQRIVWEKAVETAPNGKMTAAHVERTVQEYRTEIATPAEIARPHVSFNSGNNEWYTPAPYIEAARRVMGGIDLDPASSERANGVVQAAQFYTAEDDGLIRPWAGCVWMNPPYAAELIGRFANKLADSFVVGDVPEAIVLVNNATETSWFQSLIEVASAVVFPRSRVRFWQPDGLAGAPLQGQAVIYLGGNPKAFLNEFSAFGWGAHLWH